MKDALTGAELRAAIVRVNGETAGRGYRPFASIGGPVDNYTIHGTINLDRLAEILNAARPNVIPLRGVVS